jgi:hypothetical protein
MLVFPGSGDFDRDESIVQTLRYKVKSASLTQVVGEKGVGKTALIRRYLYDLGSSYRENVKSKNYLQSDFQLIPFLCWIDCHDEDSIRKSYLKIAFDIANEDVSFRFEAKDPEDYMKKVRSYIENDRHSYIMVFDGCNDMDEDDLSLLLPKKSSKINIILSRTDEMKMSRDYEAMSITDFSPDEAKNFMNRRCMFCDVSAGNQYNIDKILKIIGHNPGNIAAFCKTVVRYNRDPEIALHYLKLDKE